MFGLSLLDLFIILIYFGVLVIIGLQAAKRIRNQEDFLLGGRRFGKLIQTFAAFGQGTSADNAVGVSRTVFVDGIAGIWSSLLMLFSTPVYWLTSPWYRRLRLYTLAEFFEERYESRRMSMLYALMGVIGLVAIVSLGISAMSKTVLALTPKPYEALTVEQRVEYDCAVELTDLETRDFLSLSEGERDRLRELRQMSPRRHFSYLNEHVLVWGVCIVIVIYGSLGGLGAAFLTDLIQGVFILLLSVILLPFAMRKASSLHGDGTISGAMTVLHEQLPQSALELFGSPSTIDFTWYFVAAVSLMSMANTAVQPNQLVAIGSAKDEYTGRVGFVTGNFIKRVVTILWGFVALFAIILYSGQIRNPDMVWGAMTLDLLGGLGLGLVGLMIACMLSALMSTADCQMITAAGLFSKGFYSKVFPGRSEGHYVWVGRVFSVVFISLAAAFATAFGDILSLLKFTWAFFSVFAASFWLGLLWRRASRLAAWVSIVATAVLFVIGPPLVPMLFPSLRSADGLLLKNEDRLVERSYVATIGDVEVADRQGRDLSVGEAFTKSYNIAGRSIFWDQGIRHEDGRSIGAGTLHLDLWGLHALGMDLEHYPRALNETIRFLLRVLVPFGLLVSVTLVFPRNASPLVDRFFVKMRVPVTPDLAIDAARVRAAQEDPDYGRDGLMFPNSQWEMQKFRGVAATGFFICCGVVGLLLLFLYLLVA